MDCRCICSAADNSIQRIDLTDEVSLPQAANSRIAAHCADLGQVKAHQRSACTHARRGTGGLDAGMAAADNDDFEGLHGWADNCLCAERQRRRCST